MPPDSPWYSRGYLPHFDSANTIQSVTFRLADSVPESAIVMRWDGLSSKQKIELQLKIEELLDLGHGSCILRNPQCAEIVQARLLKYDGQRYRLLAWAIMPNHVHVMFQPLEGFTMAQIMQDWKGGSSFEINRLLGLSGRLWLPESFDRFIRDSDHYDNSLRYIEYNPVKAGLAPIPERWPFSSAHYRVAKP